MQNKIYATSPTLDVQLDINLIYVKISFKYSRIKREFPNLLNTNFLVTAQMNRKLHHVLQSLLFSSSLGIPLASPVVSTSKKHHKLDHLLLALSSWPKAMASCPFSPHLFWPPISVFS